MWTSFSGGGHRQDSHLKWANFWKYNSITEIISNEGRIEVVNGLEVQSALQPEQLIAAKMLQQNESQESLLDKLNE